MSEDIPCPPARECRVQYGGHLINTIICVQSANDNPLECFTCHDESLYHDAWCHWNETTDDLLCVKCFESLEPGAQASYQRALSQH